MAASPIRVLSGTRWQKRGNQMAACPICGNPKPGKRFCTQCGTKLSKTPVQTVPPAAIGQPTNAPEPTSSPTEKLRHASKSAVTQRVEPSRRPGQAYARAGSNRQLVLVLLGALLLFGGGIAGAIWWDSRKADNEQTASTSSANDTAKGNQPTVPAVVQTPGLTPNPTGSYPIPSSATASLPQSSYLWEVIKEETTGTTDAAFALDAADAKSAIVKPGAQLALAYREGQFFGDGSGDDLRVFGPHQDRVSYTIFVRDEPAAAWKRVDINRRGFPLGVAGHDIGHHGVRQARQILIRNNGKADLSIDAIAAVYKEVVSPGNLPQSRHE